MKDLYRSRTGALGVCAIASALAMPGVGVAQSASPPPAAAAGASPSAAATEEPAMTALATSLLTQAQSGQIDRTLFGGKMNDLLTPAAVAAVAQQLAPLGKPKSITFVSRTTMPDFTGYRYRVVWDAISLEEQFAIDASGKIAGWYLKPSGR